MDGVGQNERDRTSERAGSRRERERDREGIERSAERNGKIKQRATHHHPPTEPATASLSAPVQPAGLATRATKRRSVRHARTHRTAQLACAKVAFAVRPEPRTVTTTEAVRSRPGSVSVTKATRERRATRAIRPLTGPQPTPPRSERVRQRTLSEHHALVATRSALAVSAPTASAVPSGAVAVPRDTGLAGLAERVSALLAERVSSASKSSSGGLKSEYV